jgi:hypothetical protein
MAEDFSSAINSVSLEAGNLGTSNQFSGGIPSRGSALTDAQRNYHESLARSRVQTGVNNDAAAGRQSEYDFKWRAFPGNLGRDYQGHYMVININVPVRSALTGGGTAGAFTNRFTITDEFSRVDRLRNITTALENQGSNIVSSLIPRFTRRIKESVALYVPNTLVYNTHNVYEDISLSALAGQLGVGLLGLGGTARVARDADRARRGIRTNSIFGTGGGLIGRTTQLLQSPINPAIEVLFANTMQRQFVFEILMAPRNEQESINIKEIVKTLRFHAAPEVNSFGADGFLGTLLNAAASFTWIPPAEFDITFFKDGVENTNIPRINTCVLERVEVDYTPTGIHSTFSNGHPVAVRLSLGFRELEPVHKARVLQGF